MTLKQIITYNLPLTVDITRDLSNLLEDTMITAGNNKPEIVKAYGKHYGLTRLEAERNLNRFKEYRDSGDMLRYGLREL